MIALRGTGHVGGGLAALASVLALAGSARSCPPPGSQLALRDGFFRNDTVASLTKRWTAIQFGTGDGVNWPTDNTNHFGKQWPGGIIPLCFDPALTADDKAQIIDGFERGMGQWYTSGLTAAYWKLDYQSCQGVTGPTPDKLWVQKNTVSGVSASLANRAKGSVFDAQPDAYFQSSFRGVPDWKLQKARTYAHELGHVMGLIHEHQSPLAWSRKRGGTAEVDKFSLDCTALADYDACYSSVQKLFNGDAAKVSQYMTAMCATNVGPFEKPCKDDKGKDYYLSAWNYLPDLGSQQFVRTGEKIDLKSVMMYNSVAGGKSLNQPVLTLLDDSGGRTTFTPDDGYSNDPPSSRDVDAAILLSPNPRQATNQAPLFTPASSQNPTWEAASNGIATCTTDPFDDCNAVPPSNPPSPTTSDPFSDCHAVSPSRRRSLAGRNRRHESLMRRGAKARAAMKSRLLATGSYF